MAFLLVTLATPGARAADWGLTAPATAHAVPDLAARIRGIQFTGDPNAGPGTGAAHIQLTLFAGSGELHWECTTETGAPPRNREWFGPGHIRIEGTPEQLAETFQHGLIYIAPEVSAGVDVVALSAISSRGGTAFASIVVDTRPTHWEAWQADHFSEFDLGDPSQEATLWGPAASPAGDGVPNLVKFSVGRGPFATAHTLLPRPRLSNDTFFVDVACRTDVPELSLVLERSLDLIQWQAGPGAVETQRVTRMPADLESMVIRAVTDTPTQKQAFVRRKVVLGPPPAPPAPPPPPPPFTPALLAQLRSQVAAMHLVDPINATPGQRADARTQLRLSHGTVYGVLTQTMDLPSGCSHLDSIRVVSNAGHTLDETLNLNPGGFISRDRTGIDGQAVSISYEWSVMNGQNKFIFKSPYNDRFQFQLAYHDTNGQYRTATLECPGSTNPQGALVPEDDCSRPYFGTPTIFISGLAVSRFTDGGTADTDISDLIEDAINGMGGLARTEVRGSTPLSLFGGPRYFYGIFQAQSMDICRSELMARLQHIASAFGAVIQREGNIIRILGPDAGAYSPNRFDGPRDD